MVLIINLSIMNLKKITSVGAMLLSLVTLSGCSLSPESIKEVDEKIQERFNSFSTLKYTILENQYQNGILSQTSEYTEMFKKPDKIKQIIHVTFAPALQNFLYICNHNAAYSESEGGVSAYEYTNLPPDISSFCGYFIYKNAEHWKIPMELADETKYRVETSKVDYNGTEAIKAVVTTLLSEEEKQKQIEAGNAPRESTITYWFDAGNFAILKEERHSYSIECTEGNCQEMENRSEMVYKEFTFDADIPDAEFIIDAEKQIVDIQNKLD